MGFLLYEQDLAEVPGPGELPDHPDVRSLHCSVDLAMPCNMACVACPRRASGYPLTEASVKGLRQWIAQQAVSQRADRIQVSFHGGEPLLQGELFAGLSSGARRECERRGIEFQACVVTNGTLLDRVLARRLRSAGIARAQVTLEGPRRVHDRRRRWSGGPSFRKILDNLKLARDAFADLVIRVPTDAVSDHELQDLLATLDEEGLISGRTPAVVYAARMSPYGEQVRDLWKIFSLTEAFCPAPFAAARPARPC